MTMTIIVSGQQNAGKTTWVCALTDALQRRGLVVGTVKHTHHEYAVVGKDSTRHQDAGAQRVLLVSPHGAATYDAWEDEPDLLTLVMDRFVGFDVVLAEGYRGESLPKIVVGDDPRANLQGLLQRVPAIGEAGPDPALVEDVADLIAGLERHQQAAE